MLHAESTSQKTFSHSTFWLPVLFQLSLSEVDLLLQAKWRVSGTAESVYRYGQTFGTADLLTLRAPQQTLVNLTTLPRSSGLHSM